jgi:hypothetical protein
VKLGKGFGAMVSNLGRFFAVPIGAASTAGRWFARNWRALAVGLVATGVAVGLTVATGGLLGVPALTALGAGFFGGGLAASAASLVGAVGGGLASWYLGRRAGLPDHLGPSGHILVSIGLTFVSLGMARFALVGEPVALGLAPEVEAGAREISAMGGDVDVYVTQDGNLYRVPMTPEGPGAADLLHPVEAPTLSTFSRAVGTAPPLEPFTAPEPTNGPVRSKGLLDALSLESKR